MMADSLDIIPNPLQKEDTGHFFRYNFTSNFKMEDNKDWGLATPVDTEIPNYLLEIFVRFFKLNYIWMYGGRCVFMAKLLRRILRLHGYEAHTRQVIITYEHETKKDWGFQMGSPQNFMGEQELDVHMVCVVDGYILDFAVLPHLWQRQGMQAPIAFIGKDDTFTAFAMQDFGFYGKATWLPRKPRNLNTKHWEYENKDEEKEVTSQYFKIYSMTRHDQKRDFN